MKSYCFTLVLLLVMAPLSGCLQDEEPEQPGFSWQDRAEIECDMSTNVDLDCEVYLDGFNTPVLSIKHPVVNELWIVDLYGNITSWNGDTLRQVANLSGLISTCHNEQGMFGMAFDDDFEQTGAVLLSYVQIVEPCEDPAGPLTLAEAKVVDGVINPDSLKVLLQVEEPYRNHNGGHILGIGEHQYLWGVGDGGSSKDPYGHGQNTSTKLGAILLLEYSNGTVQPVLNNSSGDPYVLHHGLRNPWRFDVDPSNRLWIADVGQYCYEEINVVQLMNQTNFGWAVREGMHEFDGDFDCDPITSEPPEGLVDPVIEYIHENGHCSVTGGHWMDWGPQALRGGYLYGDFCSGSIWIAKGNSSNWEAVDVATVGTQIVGFGQGLNDELLIFSWGGAIYQVTGSPN